MLTINALTVALLFPVAAAEAPADWSQFDRAINDIASLHSLDAQAARLARRAAAGFVYVGMCRGVGFDDAMGAIGLIIGADPNVPYQAAALEMLGIYSRQSFGRQETSLCKKAYEDALP